MATVEVENLCKTYTQGSNAVAALNNVNLKIEAGSFVALAGPSGSGKTTLLNLIGGLDTPTSGIIKVDGRDFSLLNRTELSRLRRDRIGFIFQSFNLIPVLTAYENAEFVLLLQGVSANQRREKVFATLKAVGLAGLEKRFPNELSGGQQQRVAVARAIVSEPAIILADEPTANLDSKTALALLDTMRHLNEEHGCTFIFSTHDTNVMRAAKRLIYLQDGMVVGQVDNHTELKKNETHL